MSKIRLILDFLFDQFILPFLPEGKEEGKEKPDGEMGADSKREASES
jgi:hypothetical protein